MKSRFAAATIPPDLAFPFPHDNTQGATSQTIRSIVKPDLWGNRIRVRFSNVFGNHPLTLDAVTAGLQEYGGNVLSTEISAKKGTNVPQLLDQILLQAEILDLKANPNRRATGAVIEAQLDPGKGAVATVLVQNGTLRVGDDFIDLLRRQAQAFDGVAVKDFNWVKSPAGFKADRSALTRASSSTAARSADTMAPASRHRTFPSSARNSMGRTAWS